MAVLTGFHPQATTYAYAGTRSANLSAFAFSPNDATLGVGVGSLAVAGAKTGAAPLNHATAARGGKAMPGFFEDFYHRVHVRPAAIDLGNLVADVEATIEVWNAHLVPKTLGTIDAVNDDGMTLTEPAPTPLVYQPTESHLYTLTVKRVGRGIIDAAYTFDFGAELPTLTITGKRVLTWTLRANWREPVRERLTFLTDVIPARDGKEQRRALRALPRRGFDVLHQARGHERQKVDALLTGWGHRLWVLPIPTDVGVLLADALTGDDAVAVDTADFDYAPGGLVALIAPDGTDETAEISDVGAQSVTLAKPLLNDWPAGTRVQPARLARLAATHPVTNHTGELDELRCQWELEPHALATAAADSPTLYRGHPVLLDRPNRRQPVPREIQRDLAVTDNQTGVRAVHDRRGRARFAQDWLFTRLKRPAGEALRAWLLARKGRQAAFWLDNQSADLELVGPITAGTALLPVRSIDYANLLDGEPGRRDLVIQLVDGTRYFRRVLTADAPAGGQEQLTLDAVIPQDVTPADVHRISWLVPCRLAGDTAELTWHSTAVAETTLRMEGVFDDL